MTPTLKQVNQWFDYYNTLIFKGELPKVKITFNNTRRQLGQFHWGVTKGIGIKISLYYDRPEEEYKNTLVHEMCHLYCYNKGWKNEHHGPNWKKIAKKATQITGMNIQRVHEGVSEWGIARGNKGREKKIIAKKNAPCIILDLDYITHHFLIKTTEKVLLSNDSTDRNGKLKTTANSYKLYITDNDFFKRYSASRSIHRGYKYGFLEYGERIAPKLKGAKEIKLDKLFHGAYNNLLRTA